PDIAHADVHHLGDLLVAEATVDFEQQRLSMLVREGRHGGAHAGHVLLELVLRRGSAVRAWRHGALVVGREGSIGSAPLERAVLANGEEPRAEVLVDVAGPSSAKPEERVLNDIRRPRLAGQGGGIPKEGGFVPPQGFENPPGLGGRSVAREWG